ncbi:hypothetical protein REPUB_Repub11eG0160100 [Reevesia pubescens]
MTWLSRPCADLQFELQFSLIVVAGTLFSKIIAGSQTCPVLIMHCKVSADDIVLYWFEICHYNRKSEPVDSRMLDM